MPPSLWERTQRNSKRGFDKTWQALDKLGDPVNRLSYRLGAEAFWPMTLDKECEKAARIMRSFCKDGFYADEDGGPDVTPDGKLNRPKGKQHVLQKIPQQVIQRALGLAIFTTMRSGLWFSGSGGAGVLLGRVPGSGEWSPPSGIMLHTAGIGLLAGVDIYDCVVVINTPEALEAFKTFRCTIGGEISASAGPVGVGGILESEVHRRQTPIWNYMKSRGLYGGIQIDGTVIIERTDENERFYNEPLSVVDILAGKARYAPPEINGLLQTIKAAQGDQDVDESLLPPPGETPGDLSNPVSGGPVFGVPAVDDPDPFGVKALEAEGFFIREAGTNHHPSHEVFEFKPNPNSPVYATFAASRASLDSSNRTSWRVSVQSHVSVDRGTQTDNATAPTSVSRASSRSRLALSDKEDGEPDEVEEEDIEDDLEVHEVSSATVSKRGSGIEDAAHQSKRTSSSPNMESHRQSPTTFTRARLVTIPKRTMPVPPPLPPRHPQRMESASLPVSPVFPPLPSSPSSASVDGRRSEGSTDSSMLNGFAELPLHFGPASSHRRGSSGSAASLHESTIQERDEFHSISSDPSSDHESDRASDDSHTTTDARDMEPHAITLDSKVVSAMDQQQEQDNDVVHAQTI